MTKNSEELIRIYETAKERRIVLTQEEFAKMLGFQSRFYLFGKVIKSKSGVSDELIERAKDMLSGSKKEDIHSVSSCAGVNRAAPDLEVENRLLRERVEQLEQRNNSLMRELGAMEQRLSDEREKIGLSQTSSRTRAG